MTLAMLAALFEGDGSSASTIEGLENRIFENSVRATPVPAAPSTRPASVAPRALQTRFMTSSP